MAARATSRYTRERLEWLARECLPHSPTWREAAARFRERYGIGLTSTALRQGYASHREFYSLPPAGDLLNTALPSVQEIQVEVDEVRAQATIKQLQRKVRALLRIRAQEDDLAEQFSRQIQAMPPIKPPPLPKATAGVSQETVGLLLSDTHVDEVVSMAETAGYGHYNREIFIRRAQYLVDKIVDICKDKLEGYSFPTLHVFGLGDYVSGTIHEELAETNEGDPIESAVVAASVFAQMFTELAQVFPLVQVDFVHGNHGRLTKIPRYKKASVNWDYLIGIMVELLLRDQPNINIRTHKSFFYAREVEGKVFIGLHGEKLRGTWGIPYYGAKEVIRQFLELTARGQSIKVPGVLDFILVGHFHSVAWLPGGVIFNGSMVGPSEFSLQRGYAPEPPQQLLFGIYPQYGITWRFPLDLSDPPPEIRYTTGLP